MENYLEFRCIRPFGFRLNHIGSDGHSSRFVDPGRKYFTLCGLEKQVGEVDVVLHAKVTCEACLEILQLKIKRYEAATKALRDLLPATPPDVPLTRSQLLRPQGTSNGSR